MEEILGKSSSTQKRTSNRLDVYISKWADNSKWKKPLGNPEVP